MTPRKGARPDEVVYDMKRVTQWGGSLFNVVLTGTMESDIRPNLAEIRATSNRLRGRRPDVFKAANPRNSAMGLRADHTDYLVDGPGLLGAGGHGSPRTSAGSRARPRRRATTGSGHPTSVTERIGPDVRDRLRARRRDRQRDEDQRRRQTDRVLHLRNHRPVRPAVDVTYGQVLGSRMAFGRHADDRLHDSGWGNRAALERRRERWRA